MKIIKYLLLILLLIFSNNIFSQQVFSRQLNKTVQVDALIYKNDGTIFAAGGWNAPTIKKITNDGVVTDHAKGLRGIVDLAWGKNDTLVGTSYQTGELLKISPDGIVSNFARVGNGAASIFLDDNGDYLVTINPGLASPSSGSVKKVSPDGKVSTFASGGTINKPSGITKDINGNYYISNLGDGKITKILPDGTKYLFATVPAKGKWKIGYLKLWKGNMYASAISENKIFKISLDGSVSLFSGTGTSNVLDGDVNQAEWKDPNGMTISGDTLFVISGTSSTNVLRYIVDNNITDIKDKSNLNGNLNFKLFQNYPNPFNPSTTINYTVNKKTNVEIKVFDILGKEITSLTNNEHSPGNYGVVFNANNNSSGIYTYQLKAGNYLYSKKMLLVK